MSTIGSGSLCRFNGALAGTALLAAVSVSSAMAAGPALVVMGDSIGEGVQGADAAWQTQIFSYANWLSFQMSGGITFPLIQTNIFGLVGDTSQRFRLQPTVSGTDVAVSGATVNSLLYSASDAVIDTENDLVLSPRQQTQIGYVESAVPQTVVCWIGNNDALSAAISFGAMNASQLTPLADFTRDYTALVDRLGTLKTQHGTRVVLVNVPDVTSIGFLVDRQAAEAITGFPVNLPDGSYTSIVGALLMDLVNNDDLVSDPDFVLDPNEVATIRARIDDFNAVIAGQAARYGIPVVDVNTLFKASIGNPPKFYGIPLTNRLFGGLFSLDGVHPSNIGHAILANAIIDVMNQAYGTNIAKLSPQVLNAIFLTDPTIDKDHDGKATGRLGVGLLETLAFLFGFTGDANDLSPN